MSRGGIPKYAALEGNLTPTGFAGDMCAHPQFHGGPKQAVLIITLEAINELRGAGFNVFPGALGENLTTNGIDRRQMRIGQRYRIGAAIVELTKIRVPCATLDVYNTDGLIIQQAVYDKRVKAGDPSSPVWGMGGIYASVVQTGTIRTDDIIVLLDQAV